MSTSDCINALNQIQIDPNLQPLLGATPLKWKRVKKYRRNDGVTRRYFCLSDSILIGVVDEKDGNLDAKIRMPFYAEAYAISDIRSNTDDFWDDGWHEVIEDNEHLIDDSHISPADCVFGILGTDGLIKHPERSYGMNVPWFDVMIYHRMFMDDDQFFGYELDDFFSKVGRKHDRPLEMVHSFESKDITTYDEIRDFMTNLGFEHDTDLDFDIGDEFE